MGTNGFDGKLWYNWYRYIQDNPILPLSYYVAQAAVAGNTILIRVSLRSLHLSQITATLQSSRSNFIPSRIQQYNAVCMTNITNRRVIIDIVMWFCRWPPEKPWAYHVGSHKELWVPTPGGGGGGGGTPTNCHTGVCRSIGSILKGQFP